MEGDKPGEPAANFVRLPRRCSPKLQVPDYAHPSMSFSTRDFDGRVAIVTGAARGLGRAVAVRLHERGASVVVNVRDQARAAAAADALGDRALGIAGDVTLPGFPEALARGALERFGRIDILINNVRPQYQAARTSQGRKSSRRR